MEKIFSAVRMFKMCKGSTLCTVLELCNLKFKQFELSAVIWASLICVKYIYRRKYMSITK